MCAGGLGSGLHETIAVVWGRDVEAGPWPRQTAPTIQLLWPANCSPCLRSVVNIKAKTHEKVDSLGENRSIACHAVVMLLRQ